MPGPHISNNDFEPLALDRLPENALARAEEHLLRLAGDSAT
jgi:hypothetical protein